MKNKNPIIFVSTIKSTKSTWGVDLFINGIYENNKDIYFEESYHFDLLKDKVENKPNVNYVKLSTPFFYNFNKRYKHSRGETFIFNTEISWLFLIKKSIVRKNDFYIVDHGQRYKIFSLSKYQKNVFTKIYFATMKSILSPFVGSRLKYSTIVTHSVEDKEALEGKIYKFKDVKYIKSTLEDYSNGVYSYDQKSNDLLYIGKISSQKRTLTTYRMAKQLNFSIKIAGSGSNEKLMSKFAKESYVGEVNQTERANLFNTSKYFVSLSKYESFPHTLIESLMFGVPIVVLNTFPAAKYLVGSENQRGYIAKSIKDAKNWLKENINNEQQWKEKSYNARLFYMNELSKKEFNDKWNNIIGYKKFDSIENYKLLSLVIPCYGKQDEVVRASLKSIEEAIRIHSNIEAVFVYKNGPEFNYDWVEKEFSTIKVIKAEDFALKRLGKIKIGMEHVTGRYTYCFDPDDFVNLKDLNNFLKELNKHQEEILITDFLMKTRENREPLYRKMSDEFDNVILKWFTNFPGNYCTFFKTEHFKKVINNIKVDKILNNDLYIIIMNMNHFARVGFIRIPFLIYMRVKGQVGESDFAKYLTEDFIRTGEAQLEDILHNTHVNYADFNARRIANKIIQLMINGWHIALLVNRNWSEAFRKSNIMLQKLHFHRIIEKHQLYKTMNYLSIAAYPIFKHKATKSKKNKK